MRGQRRRFSDGEVKPLDQVRRDLGLDRQPAPKNPEPSDAVAWASLLTTLTPQESHHRRDQRGAVPADIQDNRPAGRSSSEILPVGAAGETPGIPDNLVPSGFTRF
jgi:hypothetical protein